MQIFNTLATITFLTILIMACEPGTETNTQSALLQDSISSVRVEPAPPARVAATTGTNKAPLANAYAQSTFSGYSVSNINDGSTNTTVGGPYSWANAYKYAPDGYLPQWVDLRFDSAITFDQLNLYTSHNYEMRDWTMLSKADSTSSWDTLGIVRDNLATSRSFTFDTTYNAEIVRILCEDGPSHQSGYARINEVQLY